MIYDMGLVYHRFSLGQAALFPRNEPVPHFRSLWGIVIRGNAKSNVEGIESHLEEVINTNFA
jgi:hypothetical protein